MKKKSTTLGHTPLSPYQEAQRYLANARSILKEKAGKKDGEYADIKYVKMAAGTAYLGVLLAIDEYLSRKQGPNFQKPTSIEAYRTQVAKQNKKLLALLNEVYTYLHLSGYYHGNPSVKLMANGLQTSNDILEYIKD